MSLISRRGFIKKASLTASVIPFFNLSCYARPFKSDESLSVSIFSKHLQFLDYHSTGEMAAEMGFSGVDLTVRPKGHVLPENVKTDLLKAVKAIEAAGSQCQMITTAVESVENPLDVDVLKAASANGVRYYRSNWFKYKEGQPMQEALEMYKNQVEKLGELNKQLGLIGCYQNHSGQNVGASFWEVKKILETVDPEFFGTQYDIRHAHIEGGKSWENGLKLLQPHIKTIVLKDYKWGHVNGQWKIINTPVGEGMIDFDKYFKLLKKYKLNPPVSLHLEYPLGGAEKGNTTITVDKKTVFEAMKKDLNSIQRLWKSA